MKTHTHTWYYSECSQSLMLAVHTAPLVPIHSQSGLCALSDCARERENGHM